MTIGALAQEQYDAAEQHDLTAFPRWPTYPHRSAATKRPKRVRGTMESGTVLVMGQMVLACQ